jgi:cytochrome P450
MDSRYDEYFRRRLQELKEGEGVRPTEARTARQDVREIADTAVSAAGDVAPLRSDAEVLLYMLAAEFVGAPLDDAGESTGEVREMVYADARLIAETATEYAAEDGVSAHAVIRALDRSWDKLRTTALNVWG